MRSLALKSQEITSLIINNEGEITQELDAYLNNLDLSIAAKSDQIGYCFAQIENQIEFLKSREEEIKEARKRLEKNLEDFETRVKAFIRALDRDKIEGDLYTLGFRKSAGRVIVNDLDALPEEYKTTKVTIDADKKKLKETLALGIEVPGAVIEYEPSLTRKIKTV